MKHLISRRSFLRALRLEALGLSLTACGTSTSADDEIRDGEDEADSIVAGNNDGTVGYTLEEAQRNNDYNNIPYFIHRSDGLFYPIAIPLIPRGDLDGARAVFLDYEDLAYYSYRHSPPEYPLRIHEGDELVYISTGNELDSRQRQQSTNFVPVLRSGLTFPITFEFDSNYENGKIYTLRKFYYSDDKYKERRDAIVPQSFKNMYEYRSFVDYDRYSGTTDCVISESDGPLTINGLEFSEYIASHIDDLYVAWSASSNGKTTTRCFVDLSAHAGLNYAYATNEFTLLDADDECYATIAFYIGTNYYDTDLDACCEYYAYDPEMFTSCPNELTQNGYFVVDISEIAADLNTSDGREFLIDCNYASELSTPTYALIDILG